MCLEAWLGENREGDSFFRGGCFNGSIPKTLANRTQFSPEAARLHEGVIQLSTARKLKDEIDPFVVVEESQPGPIRGREDTYCGRDKSTTHTEQQTTASVEASGDVGASSFLLALMNIVIDHACLSRRIMESGVGALGGGGGRAIRKSTR